MTIQELLKGESKNIEFKRQLPEKSEKYIKTIIAFANTAGGKLIVGIDDESREVLGVEESSVFQIMDAIANAVSDMCEPQIVPDISFQTIDHKCIVIIEIYPGANRPYYIRSQGRDKGTYIRLAGTTRPADALRIKELELQGANLSYDEMISIGHEINDKAVGKLCGDIRKYMLEDMVTAQEKKAINEVTLLHLENWGIVKRVEGKLLATNAFVLLTSDEFRFSRIQCARFKGTERVVFIDKREFKGPLYEQVEEAYQFVLKHINLGAQIEGLIRKDSYELPVASIRESIVNAVTHRNYMENSCIQIAVFDDRVEITSPGMLYGDLSIETIKQGKSKIRNKGIAEVFNRMNIIEEWGTGISRIIAGCLEYQLPEPEFLEFGDSFRVNIFRKQESSQESSQETAVGNSYQGLNATQTSMLQMMKEDEMLRQQDIALALNLSLGAIKKNVIILKEKGFLERTGSTKKGRWIVH